MTGRVVRFADRTPTRWANGQGETVEIARLGMPDGDGDGFAWRLSVATVGSSAWFSALPDVDRAIMALAPEGLGLEVDGRDVPLARFAALRFPGEVPVRALDVARPGQDLNLMVRRGLGTPVLEAVVVHGALSVPADALAVVVLDGTVTLGDDVDLAPWDTVLGDPGGTATDGGPGDAVLRSAATTSGSATVAVVRLVPPGRVG